MPCYPGSLNLAADIAKLPIFTTVGGTFGVGQRFGLLDVALKGMIDRKIRCSPTAAPPAMMAAISIRWGPSYGRRAHSPAS